MIYNPNIESMLRFGYFVARERDGIAQYTFCYDKPVQMPDSSWVLEYAITRCDPKDKFEKAKGRAIVVERYVEGYLKMLTSQDAVDNLSLSFFMNERSAKVFDLNCLKHNAICQAISAKENSRYQSRSNLNWMQ